MNTTTEAIDVATNTAICSDIQILDCHDIAVLNDLQADNLNKHANAFSERLKLVKNGEMKPVKKLGLPEIEFPSTEIMSSKESTSAIVNENHYVKNMDLGTNAAKAHRKNVEKNVGEITIASTVVNDRGVRVKDKIHCCHFCGKFIQQMAIHFEIKHSNELEVARSCDAKKN